MLTRIEPPPDFSLRETLMSHGWRRLQPFTCDDETLQLQRIEQLKDGRVVLLTISDSGDGGLLVESSLAANDTEVVNVIKRMLQVDVPLDAFHSYCAGHEKLSHIPSSRQGRVLISPTLWEDCCKVVLTTNTTWSQTVGMTARLCEHFGSPCPEDPTHHAFPGPKQIASVSFEEFAEKAKLGYRAGAVHGLGRDIIECRIDLESFRDPAIPSDELWKMLIALRGVGPYAAACLMIYLGRYDRVNVDSWARMMVGKELGRKVTDKEVHDFFEPHGEWRALVYHFYPWREDPPAY